tara:strand:- start:2409 stop:2696 length:288 start_codon:yes stop_codon:yes gene_type:complete
MIIKWIKGLKKVDLDNINTILLLLSIDCFVFGFVSAFATILYIWYLELTFEYINQYFVTLLMILLHMLACYNYALSRYAIYSEKLISHTLKRLNN